MKMKRGCGGDDTIHRMTRATDDDMNTSRGEEPGAHEEDNPQSGGGGARTNPRITDRKSRPAALKDNRKNEGCSGEGSDRVGASREHDELPICGALWETGTQWQDSKRDNPGAELTQREPKNETVGAAETQLNGKTAAARFGTGYSENETLACSADQVAAAGCFPRQQEKSNPSAALTGTRNWAGPKYANKKMNAASRTRIGRRPQQQTSPKLKQ
jgi:hypothetical protein